MVLSLDDIKKEVDMDKDRGDKEKKFKNESMLKYEFIKALEQEFSESLCNKYIRANWLIPALDETIRTGRPDIRISNLVIEVEPPAANLEVGREQLMQYMRELYEEAGKRVKVYGLVTNGSIAELWEYDKNDPKQIRSGSMPDVVRDAIERFCSQEKIPVINAEDLIRLVGV